MDVNRKQRQILSVLARPVRAVVEGAGLDFGQVREIRVFDSFKYEKLF